MQLSPVSLSAAGGSVPTMIGPAIFQVSASSVEAAMVIEAWVWPYFA